MNKLFATPSRLVLIGCALLLLLGGALWLVRPADAMNEELQALTAARVRWATRPFFNYQLHVRDICEQNVTVSGIKVVEATSTRCDLRGRSVDELFTLIERNETVSISCVSRGCVCDDILTVHASYDATLGYPRTIEVRVQARPNPRHPDYWKQLWSTWRLPECNRMLEGSKTIRVMSLTPL